MKKNRITALIISLSLVLIVALGAVSAFAKYIGMNASLLRQYASGAKIPKTKALAKIREGLQKLGNELNAEVLIEKPATEYIK